MTFSSTQHFDIRRNIAIFIDGTWNESSGRNKTNVRKMFELFKAASRKTQDLQSVEQFGIYISGVGTEPEVELFGSFDASLKHELDSYFNAKRPNFFTKLYRRLVGGATGRGTAARIKVAYHFLSKTFRHKSKDTFYLFGFSRGAFAARSLVGFLNYVGLCLKDLNSDRVEKAYLLYERGDKISKQEELLDFLKIYGFERFIGGDDELYVPIHLLGVWDTVSSLGLPSKLEKVTARYTKYHQVELPPVVVSGRHALALHELRSQFEPLLWSSDGRRDLRQVWFPGAHADVGGGYPSGEDSLSNVALAWMVQEAECKGLILGPLFSHQSGSKIEVKLHHEFWGAFILSRPKIRKWVSEYSALSDDGFYFHETTRSYLVGMAEYNFRAFWVNKKLKKVDHLAFDILKGMMRCGLLLERNEIQEFSPWWLSATREKLVQSNFVIELVYEQFIDINSSSIPAFSTDLALLQLFGYPGQGEPESAVIRFIHKISSLSPLDFKHIYAPEELNSMKVWLEKGRMIREGLRHVEKLLDAELSAHERSKLDTFCLGIDTCEGAEHEKVSQGYCGAAGGGELALPSSRHRI